MSDGRPSVLLVDDKPENLVALRAVLEPLDLNLVDASSGDEALKRLLEHDFAVILLDVQMPGMDGFETAEFIKQRERTKHIPIIFVTAISKEAHHVFRGYSTGAVDYIFKPYDPWILRSKVSVFVDLYEKNAALQASEERLRAAFAEAPIGKVLLSTGGDWVQVNRAFCEMLGYEPREVLAKTLDEVTHPDDRGADRDFMLEMLGGHIAEHRSERRFVRADGKELHTLVHISLTHHADGRPFNFVLQAVDITERKRAEHERTERMRERAARGQAEAVAETVQKLQTITDAALAHLALDDVMRELLGRISEIFGVDRATILLSEPGVESVAVGVTVGPDGVVERGIRIPVSREFAERIAADSPVMVERVEDADVSNPLLRDEDVRSLLAVPLTIEGRVDGVLHIGSLTGRSFTKEDADLLQLVADRASLAIEHARLYEREHGIVETLQRSLLPDRMPQVPGLELAARYLPGARGAEVGGDWYDAIPLDDGRLGVAMGDVVGHGLGAAALMGRLRNALRAYALEGHPPAEALVRLDRMVQNLEPGRMATLIYLVIESDASAVTYATAGHLPPLVLAPGGEATYLVGDHSVPLGVLPGSEYGEQRADIEPGSTLVFYTDGLVEERGVPIDKGLEGLKWAVKEGPADAEALCDHIVSLMLSGREAMDDVAVLALRTVPVTGDRLRLELPAEPKALKSLRSTLGRWLEEAGAAAGESQEIQLACHEACSNAIEHAYRFGDAPLEVEASLEDGRVVLAIRDSGGWRAPRETNRGRGVGLMEALMDSVEITPGDAGTTVEMSRRLGRRDNGAGQGV
jgi:PAS domain S-box-containing protein